MSAISVFIDGFNVYHALDSDKQFRKYKWLNYAELAKCYVGGRDNLFKVTLFTAFTTWDNSKVARHRDYVQALKSAGVEIVMGKFKMKDKWCRNCKSYFRTPEEKLTDVNIAIELFAGAQAEEYDKAILITGDTDIIPAVNAVRRVYPKKQIGVVIPIGRKSEDLKHTCDFHFRMKEAQLARCQFPDEIQLPSGQKLTRPDTWR